MAFLTGEDLKNRNELLRAFNQQIEKNLSKGEVIIASGLAEFHKGSDDTFLRVFERADRTMYERKRALKGL